MGSASLVLAIRLAKFLAVALFVAGLAGTFTAETVARRKVVVAAVLAPGFLLTWASGFALSIVTRSPLFTPFVLYTLLASFIALQAALYYGLAEGRSRAKAITVCALGLGASLFFMVFRHWL